MTAQEAINKSLAEDQTVALNFDAQALEDLLRETSDYASGTYYWQFWGEDERGKSWHVRMNHPSPSTSPSTST